MGSCLILIILCIILFSSNKKHKYQNYNDLLKKKEKQQQDKNKKYTYEDFVNETEENPLNTTIQKFANKRQKINNKQAQIRNGTYTYSTRRYSKQKIESEGITYDSIKEFADFLSVKYFNLWKQIKEYLKTIKGVSLASDAFFPFSDNIERARKSGVCYIAEPGGSVRDDLVIECCNKYGMAMAFTGIRLFHH